jgi:hypothetical protein
MAQRLDLLFLESYKFARLVRPNIQQACDYAVDV